MCKHCDDARIFGRELLELINEKASEMAHIALQRALEAITSAHGRTLGEMPFLATLKVERDTTVKQSRDLVAEMLRKARDGEG
jgi:hypothetical protein